MRFGGPTVGRRWRSRRTGRTRRTASASAHHGVAPDQLLPQAAHPGLRGHARPAGEWQADADRRWTKAFATVRRVWRTGDTVTTRGGMPLRLEALPANGGPAHPEAVALLYGPLVLFALREPGEIGPLAVPRMPCSRRSAPRPRSGRSTTRRSTRLVPFSEVGDRLYTLYLQASKACKAYGQGLGPYASSRSSTLCESDVQNAHEREGLRRRPQAGDRRARQQAVPRQFHRNAAVGPVGARSKVVETQRARRRAEDGAGRCHAIDHAQHFQLRFQLVRHKVDREVRVPHRIFHRRGTPKRAWLSGCLDLIQRAAQVRRQTRPQERP